MQHDRAHADQRPGADRDALADQGAGPDIGALLQDRAAAEPDTGRDRGVGLNNVQRRLATHYGTQASLSISSQVGKGTRVTLRLPGGRVHEVAVASRNMASQRQ